MGYERETTCMIPGEMLSESTRDELDDLQTFSILPVCMFLSSAEILP